MSETGNPVATGENPATSATTAREPSAPSGRGELIREFLLKQSEVRITRCLNPHREERPYLPLIRATA